MKELVKLVEQWSVDKGLDKADSRGQFLKVVEEVGEVAAAMARSNKSEIKDGIGDSVVTLIIYAQQNNLSGIIFDFTDYGMELDRVLVYKSVLSAVSSLDFDEYEFVAICKINKALENLNELALQYDFTLKECLQAAYDEISGRTGKMVNGVFVKSEDLPKPEYNPDTWLNKKGSIAGHK